MTLTSELIIVQLSHFVLYLISEDQVNYSKTFLQTEPAINQHAAPLAHVDVHHHRHNDSEVNPFQNGDVEVCDEPHDIVAMEELSHDIYEEVQIEQIN